MRDQLAVSSEQLAVSYRQFANASQQEGSFVFYLFFNTKCMASYKEMIIFKKAFELAMDILVISKKFPKEETYHLTDQIRRS